MALLDMQRSSKEIGRIRIGDSTPEISAKSGKAYRRPRKLQTFKFTTRSASIAAKVVEKFGGEVILDERLGYGVVTEVSEIGVTVPPGDAIVNQAWELWDGGACLRRCDGLACQTWIEGKREIVACLCPAEGENRTDLAKTGNACKPTTRLNVIVPDLPDVGVWRLESHGYNAAGEIGDTARILMAAREANVYLPARLWLDKRSSKDPGGATREFVVPMLTLEHSLRELSAASGSFASALPAPPLDRKAIAAAPAQLPDEGRPVENLRTSLSEDEPIDAEIIEESIAQQIADKARASASKSMITALAHRAHDQGHAHEIVQVDGRGITLADYMAQRQREIG